MSQPRQLPLFLPQQEAEINRHTPLSATLPLFQQHLQRSGKSGYTLRAFTSDLGLLAQHARADLPPGDFTTERLHEFLVWLEYGRGVPCSRKSWARRVTTLKVYFAWLRSLNAIDHDPAAAIAQRSGPAPLASVLTPAERSRALAGSPTRRRGRTRRCPARAFAASAAGDRHQEGRDCPLAPGRLQARQ